MASARSPYNETAFEKHFCQELDVWGGYSVRKDPDLNSDKELCLNFEELEEFLRATQNDELTKFKQQFHTQWVDEFKKALHRDLGQKQLFMLFKEGVQVNEFHFDLVYFKPENETNTAMMQLYEKNRFMAVRQWYFGRDVQNLSIDIVLLINGFASVTIELKNDDTSGPIENAINQYINRPLELPIFKQPFLHIACDNERVKMATLFSEPPSEKDFRDFNMDLVNELPEDPKEFPVHYLYHDILLPDRLLNFIESYLYPGKGNGWIFPRFHQQRATKMVVDDIKKKFKETGELDLKYLIQHSTGSGKSNTIVWMVQNLRNAFVDDEKIFDSIVVLTDRVNLDDQISKDFRKAINTDGIAEYAEKTEDLKKALEQNKKVIVSTIHKFSHLKDLADQSQKRICILIDEAHRSQEGELHKGVTGTFSDEEGVEADLPDVQEKFIEEIQEIKYPNLTFIALTATPSDKTLKHFGKKGYNKKGDEVWEPHDVYSMEQAIGEGYIMDVAKFIYSYDTLYEMNKDADTKKEYLPMMVRRALRQKAFEDTEIIKEKCSKMLNIFKNESAHKIKGKARAMIVSSSRLAAVKYKLFMDEEIAKQGLNYKCLVAFSGSIDFDSNTYTEEGMNRPLNPQNIKTEEVFEQNDDIKFLIVANKFQTGFSEPLLHTMFVDKPLRDRNAVQTLSRLNRIHPDKTDTLVVDFTGSYELIMKAYKKYQETVVTDKVDDPNELFALKDAIDKYGVYIAAEYEEIIELIKSRDERNAAAIAGLLIHLKKKFENNLNREKRDEFRTLISRYIASYKYISVLYRIPQGELTDFQIFLIYLRNKIVNSDVRNLKKELEDVYVVNHAIPEVEIDEEEEESGGGSSGGGSRGAITSVKQTKTVKEVIEEINAQFRELLGDQGVEIIGDFLEQVTADEELISDVVNNPPPKDPEKVYQEILKAKLKDKLTMIVMTNAPDKYEEIMSDNVLPFISKTAYTVLRKVANAA